MSKDAKAHVTTQVYEVYIKAPPQAIWDAITQPECLQGALIGAPVGTVIGAVVGGLYLF